MKVVSCQLEQQYQEVIMKKRGIIVALALFYLGLTPVITLAKSYCEDGDRHGAVACIPCQRKECLKIYMRYADEIGLSEEQVEKLRDYHYKKKKRIIKNKAEVDIIKLEIHQLLDEDEPNQDKIDAKLDKLGPLKAERAKICIQATLMARKLLTPEQRKSAKRLSQRLKKFTFSLPLKQHGGKVMQRGQSL